MREIKSIHAQLGGGLNAGGSKNCSTHRPTSRRTATAGTLGEIEAKGCVVVKGADRPVAVFRHEERVHAVDNRCPHMGFPFLNERAEMAMLIARK